MRHSIPEDIESLDIESIDFNNKDLLKSLISNTSSMKKLEY